LATRLKVEQREPAGIKREPAGIRSRSRTCGPVAWPSPNWVKRCGANEARRRSLSAVDPIATKLLLRLEWVLKANFNRARRGRTDTN
jgi:hypothetical protein